MTSCPAAQSPALRRGAFRLAAEYTLAEDDLYVRARVESDEPALYYTTGGDGPMHPKTSTAWTQPVLLPAKASAE